jgi:exocyst complex component 2
MHKAILMVVEAHAKIGDTLPSSAATGGLVNRVLIALVTTVTEVALRCFQQVPKYGTGGMLTVSPCACRGAIPDVKATLEIEFFHQSVNPYVTPAANDTLSKIYDTISQAYRRQKSSDDFHRELEGLKKLLGESRKATGLETICFKSKKEDRVRELREAK